MFSKGHAQRGCPRQREDDHGGQRHRGQVPRAPDQAPAPVDALVSHERSTLAPVLELAIEPARRQHGESAHGPGPYPSPSTRISGSSRIPK
jgi:hypothetical protein